MAKIGQTLSDALNEPVTSLWKMQNGYALCTRAGLDAISKHLAELEEDGLDFLRGKLCVGIHRDVEVTDAAGEHGPLVSQAFCSALPVAYSSVPSHYWAPFATLVLQAAYEATMWAAVLNAERGASSVVLLTALGGGAFGNDERWILAAMRRTLQMMRGFDLDVKLVCYAMPSIALSQMAAEFTEIL